MDTDRNRPRLPLDTHLHAAAAYASLLSFVVGPLLPLVGLSVDEKFLSWLILIGAALPALGLVYISSRYASAKVALDEKGHAPRPEWLWTLLSDNITHEKEDLSGEAQVMVLAPHGARPEAELMRQVYNGEPRPAGAEGEQGRGAGRDVLLFHCLPEPVGGEVDEKFGETLEEDGRRSLRKLGKAMKDCAALVLLDDSTWQKYEQTYEAVVKWGVQHTERPIISVRVGPNGSSLHYNDFKFDDIIRGGDDEQPVDREYQPLPGLLLTQADNRSKRWRRQAGLHRRLLIWLAGASFVLLVASVLVGYSSWSRFAVLRRVTAVAMGEHAEAARALAAFRKEAAPPHPEPFRRLLEVNAQRFNAMLGRASDRADAKLNVILFAVIGDQSRADDPLTIREVAATRQPRDMLFLDVRRKANVNSIVGCAVAERAFVLWTGESRSSWARSDKIEAWNLRGRPVGKFLPGLVGEKSATPGALQLNDTKCWYTTGEKDDERKRILCAPVGMDDDAAVGQVTGALCVSSEDDTDFLSAGWVRHAILYFGNSLSFTSWDAALPPTPTPSPPPAATPPRPNRGGR